MRSPRNRRQYRYEERVREESLSKVLLRKTSKKTSCLTPSKFIRIDVHRRQIVVGATEGSATDSEGVVKTHNRPEEEEVMDI